MSSQRRKDMVPAKGNNQKLALVANGIEREND
jgi:hypothetical protein